MWGWRGEEEGHCGIFPDAAGQVKLFLIPVAMSPSCPPEASFCLGARAAGRAALLRRRMWPCGPLRYLHQAGAGDVTQTGSVPASKR